MILLLGQQPNLFNSDNIAKNIIVNHNCNLLIWKAVKKWKASQKCKTWGKCKPRKTEDLLLLIVLHEVSSQKELS